jgi:hypothetical protein
MPSKFNRITHATLLKKLIKAERTEEMFLIYVWLFGIKALLGTNLHFWPGPSTVIGTK